MDPLILAALSQRPDEEPESVEAARVRWRQAWNARGDSHAAPARLAPTIICLAEFGVLGLVVDAIPGPTAIKGVLMIAGFVLALTQVRREKLARERRGSHVVRQRWWLVLPVLCIAGWLGWGQPGDHFALKIAGVFALFLTLSVGLEVVVSLRARRQSPPRAGA